LSQWQTPWSEGSPSISIVVCLQQHFAVLFMIMMQQHSVSPNGFIKEF